MKKLSLVAVVVCLFVGSAFATWDFFPPKEKGKGEAKLGFEYGMDRLGHDASDIPLYLSGRFGIIDGLEAGLSLPIPMSASVTGTNAKGDKETESVEGYAGLSLPQIMVRYWLLDLGLGFYVDLTLPVDTRYDKEGKDKKSWQRHIEPTLGLGLGVQYSRAFTEEFSLGSQLGLNIPTEESESKHKEGMGLYLGLELDYAIGIVTPFLGFEVDLPLTQAQVDGKDVKYDKDNDKAPSDIGIWLGAAAKFSDMLSADASVKFRVSDKYKYFEKADEKSYTPIIIGVNVSCNF
jgi:hypothetical protein